VILFTINLKDYSLGLRKQFSLQKDTETIGSGEKSKFQNETKLDLLCTAKLFYSITLHSFGTTFHFLDHSQIGLISSRTGQSFLFYNGNLEINTRQTLLPFVQLASLHFTSESNFP
jgi:hypothetical protein